MISYWPDWKGEISYPYWGLHRITLCKESVNTSVCNRFTYDVLEMTKNNPLFYPETRPLTLRWFEIMSYSTCPSSGAKVTICHAINDYQKSYRGWA